MVQAHDRQALNAALLRLKRGERAAADEVFRRAWPVVRAFASRWLRGSAVAEDVAQRALMKVFARVVTYDERFDALTWVLEVTVWECRTERTNLRRRPSGAEMPEVVSEETPAVLFEAHELAAAVNEAVSGLSEADQREVARVLGDEVAGDAAARKRRQRALERLKALWRTLHGE